MIETATPLYIDLLLYAMYALVLLAIGFTAWSMVRSMRRQGPDNSRSNRIPARRIGVLILALLAASLGLTYLLSDTRMLIINGKPFDDRFWLRVSDMLINTSAILIVVAAVAILIGYSGIVRKLKR